MPEFEGVVAHLQRLLRLDHPATQRGGEHGRARGATGWRRPQAHSSERASFHDENCAGDAVTWQRLKSLTLICEATWVLTKGKMLRAQEGR